ncbi:nucleoside deaminase [Paractinoplanes brasiliensis]|uniref:tRNA(Adenine34) deaminase n=1 Tax=Paractinoplanes brasiliensis TaxID=52695 RepID=A0A4R6JBY6_9ACTN|nr:deaminase [Actinoplanes brasiliensis]TDO32026.1 tRNA(adenine34) deaminase [Actinoplanes brasiliensis]GID28071.1 tRNA-specific adenosine deaminase [Actinoplanes brasiliensis]
MTPDELMQAALETAEQGMTNGELPIGAAVELDGDIIARAWTRDNSLNRRLVHADLLAMTAADETLGWKPRPAPLRLAVTLEPCLMCMGAAMALKVTDVYYALESPADGGARVAATWPYDPALPWYRPPAITAGLRRAEAQDKFRRYAEAGPDNAFRRWSRHLATTGRTEHTP